MAAFLKLDQDLVTILCCPLCKGALHKTVKSFLCGSCASVYPKRRVTVGRHEEEFFDFRIHRPPYCLPKMLASWCVVQKVYEESLRDSGVADDLDSYLGEIDTVKEIYTDEFRIQGRVLDVGGNQGRLRHFLSENDARSYVSVDPFVEVFRDLDHQPNLLAAYACLRLPCNFLACYAENTPFVNGAFDWVHMRSVLDHFQDPYLAIKEAYRVLKEEGNLLVGVAVRGGKSPLRLNESGVSYRVDEVIEKIRREGLAGLGRAAFNRMRRWLRGGAEDDHMFHWNYEDLRDLLREGGFTVTKEHWQKPPVNYCIYISARKEQREAATWVQD